MQARIEEKRLRDMDPVKLSKKVDILEKKLAKQTKDYYTELSVYRDQFRKKQTSGL